MRRMPDMHAPSTIAEIIAELGVTALSKALRHRNVSTVSSWKLRGSIPVSAWPAVIAFAHQSGFDGIDYATLVGAHTTPTPSEVSAPDSASLSAGRESREALQQQLDDSRAQLARQRVAGRPAEYPYEDEDRGK